MRNPDLPKLLRARRDVMQSEGLQVIYEQSAIELDKLEKIYQWAKDNKHCPYQIHSILYIDKL